MDSKQKIADNANLLSNFLFKPEKPKKELEGFVEEKISNKPLKLQVYVKGVLVEFVSHYLSHDSAMAALERYVDAKEIRSSFALDLVAKQGKLSEKQLAWVHKIVTDYENQKSLAEDTPRLARICKFFEGRKRAVLRFAHGENRFRLSWNASKGCIFVSSDEKNYNDRTYYGRVEDNGDFKPSHKADEDIVDALLDCNGDPVEYAVRYGKLTGNCAVCGRTLSNAVSIDMGIGPICRGDL